VIRVLLADDHAIVRSGVKRLLDDTADIRVASEARSGAELLEQLESGVADVAVIDVSMPNTSFTSLMAELKRQHPSVRIVVLSAHEEREYAIRAIRAGASAYVPKEHSMEELAGAIRTAAAGRRYVSPSIGQLLAEDVAAPSGGLSALSDRELEVLRLLVSGHTVKEASQKLGLSAKTVSTYRARVLEKLGLRTTSELVRYAGEHGLT
jgi:two-component system invasion response regulator UvrY